MSKQHNHHMMICRRQLPHPPATWQHLRFLAERSVIRKQTMLQQYDVHCTGISPKLCLRGPKASRCRPSSPPVSAVPTRWPIFGCAYSFGSADAICTAEPLHNYVQCTIYMLPTQPMLPCKARGFKSPHKELHSILKVPVEKLQNMYKHPE